MLRPFLERLLLIVTGVGATGCVDRDVPDTATDTGSSPTTAEPPPPATTTGSTPTTTTATTTSTSEDSSVTDSADTLVGTSSFDHGFDPPERCLDEPPADGLACETEPFYALVYRCTPLPLSASCADVDLQALVDETNTCFGTECSGPWVWNVACGPDPAVADACCYLLNYEEGQVCPGRPFLVDGRCRLAPTVPRADWTDDLTDDDPVPALDAPTRHALAAAFAEAAAFEHASVASFSRFTLELLAVGAPARLVAASASAVAEELAHARLFYALAARHGGAPLGPGPLDIAGSLAPTDLERAALRAAAEGCIAETVSAWQALAAARHARDPGLRARLAALADEELRHCELAWRFVRWALGRAPTMRPALRAVFAAAPDHLPRGPGLSDAADPALLRAHGMLPPEDRRHLAREALERLVAPAARALLDPPHRATEATCPSRHLA